MSKTLRVVLVSLVLIISGSANADIFDRINSCESSGGGSCVYNLLRELASRPTGGGEIINAGVYASDSYEMTISSQQNTITISGTSSISEAGEYQCTGSVCTGPSYSFTINSRDKITMNYGRVWTRRP